MAINADVIKGKWKELKGEVKKKWSKLTDDDIAAINGKSEELSGRLQKKYGYSKEEAKREIDDFTNTLR